MILPDHVLGQPLGVTRTVTEDAARICRPRRDDRVFTVAGGTFRHDTLSAGFSGSNPSAFSTQFGQYTPFLLDG